MSSKRCILVKNFPKSLKNGDITDFLGHFGAASVDIIGKKNIFAFAHFRNEVDTEIALRRLHEFEFLGRRLKAFYKNDKQIIPFEKTEEEPGENKIIEPNIRDFVKKLVVNFNKLPDPSLKYKYPKASRDIIESISMALESVPKFYVQVLHLMNKMNLPPPFNPKKIDESAPKIRSIAIQTEDISLKSLLRNLDESEIESDEEETKNALKRKNKTENEGAKRLKMMAKTRVDHSALHGGSHLKIDDVFERPEKIKAFTIKPPEQKISKEVSNKELVNGIKILSNEEMVQSRLKPNEMTDHKLFANYNPGSQSNKLYVKNIQNSVTEEELKAIFYRYIENGPEEVQIKHFKEGKLKNQAFITFDTENLEIVEQARHETNGFMLRNRPLIVVFAKNPKENV